jgi:hypothetical protein
MSKVKMKSIVKYAIVAIALLLVGVLAIGTVGIVYAQIYQPISQSGGGVRIAQPVAQGGFIGSSVVSAPYVSGGSFVSSAPVPGYACYQSFAGGPFTCYPANTGIYASNGVYSTGGTYYTGGGIYQPVQQTGFGTQVAAPFARI